MSIMSLCFCSRQAAWPGEWSRAHLKHDRNPQGAVRLTQVMDGACEERHPEARPRPDFSSFLRASQLFWATCKRHIDYDMRCDAFASKSERDCCRASDARSGEHNRPFVTKGIFGGCGEQNRSRLRRLVQRLLSTGIHG